jgi:hypothetical protein
MDRRNFIGMLAAAAAVGPLRPSRARAAATIAKLILEAAGQG